MVRWVFVCLLIVGVFKCVNSSQSLYNENLYQSVLDNVTCQRHLEEMDFFEFFDASGRIPQSIRLGGQVSLGNYHQCLSITQHVHETVHDVIMGKYCMIAIPLRQLSRTSFNHRANPKLNETLLELINMIVNATEINNGFKLKKTVGLMMGHSNLRRMSEPQGVLELEVKVAVCIPRSCTTYQAFGQYVEMLNVSYQDLFCRLPGDKIFSTADYVAVITIAILGTLTVLSSSYDLCNAFVLHKAPAETSKLLTSFSVFTNTRRLLTFSKTPDSIDCLDGLRSLSILTIVLGHAFSNKIFLGMTINLFEGYMWGSTSKATWIQSAALSVDTFFMISGLLIVYTTAKKMTPMSLVKNLHLFYLHRLLRMFPLLATMVLFQASLIQHVTDGPVWPALAFKIEPCRDWWWSALLHVQNYVNNDEICLSQTWYLAVDTQLHVVSPLVLFWVLRGGLIAWLSLTAGLMASIICSASYFYFMNYLGASWLSTWPELLSKLCDKEHFNILARAPSFFVGLTFGYLLHVWRECPRRIPTCLIGLGWLAALVLGSGMVYCNNPEADPEAGQFLTSFVKSFRTGVWAVALGWVVFACDAGYGAQGKVVAHSNPILKVLFLTECYIPSGPINWFLSLRIWKFLARISYSLYLVHYPLQAIIRAQSEVPFMFSPRTVFFLFCSDISLSLVVATALWVLVDAPFFRLQKILLQGNLKLAGPSIKKETVIF